jgi:hypothetical protein
MEHESLYRKIILEYSEFKKEYIYDKKLDNIKLKMKENISNKIIMELLSNNPINYNHINLNYKEIPYEKIYIIEDILKDIYIHSKLSFNVLINFLCYFPINIHLILLHCLLDNNIEDAATMEYNYKIFIAKYVL